MPPEVQSPVLDAALASERGKAKHSLLREHGGGEAEVS